MKINGWRTRRCRQQAPGILLLSFGTVNICVVDNLVGFYVDNCHNRGTIKHMDLKEIIKDAVVISEVATFAEALHTMNTGHTNTLLVTNDEGVLTGEVSVSDLFDAIIPTNTTGDDALSHLSDEEAFQAAVHAARDIPIFDFMSSDFDTVTPDGSLLQVAAAAIGQGRARIAVVDHDNRPVGIISRSGLKQVLEAYL